MKTSSVVWRSTQEAEGTPLERVQVVNSGARVQIPPSPFENLYLQATCGTRKQSKKVFKNILKKLLTKRNERVNITKLSQLAAAKNLDN